MLLMVNYDGVCLLYLAGSSQTPQKVIHRFSSTPLTIERISGNLDGGITGWAFTNKEIPAVTKMTKISKSCLTPIPNVLQAGQWTYSPSGVPISILTGKIAADKAEKD